MRGFALGVYRDPLSTQTQCYISSDTVATKLGITYQALISPDINNFFNPFTLFNQVIVDISDQLVTCSQNLFINQFHMRTSSISGAINTLFNVVYSLITSNAAGEAFM